MILLNAKPEELVKYSKGNYNKDMFVENVKSVWDLTDKQIRMTFLISDLAEKAVGVFSVSNEKFREMFEARFKMKISRSTVIRFFQLLEELGLLSVHEGRRKNRQQSANIFIIEPIKNKEEPNIEIPHEIPVDTLDETPFETPCDTQNKAFNNAFNNSLNKDINTSLNKSVVNNLVTSKQEIIDKLILEYMEQGLSKELCFMVLSEVEANPDVKNFGGYLRTCLENTLYRSRFKHGLIEIPERQLDNGHLFYNWLEEREESDEVVKSVRVHNPLFDWLNE